MSGRLNAAGWVIVTGLGEGPRAQKSAWKSTQTLHRELKDFRHVTDIGRPFRSWESAETNLSPSLQQSSLIHSFPWERN